MMEKKVVLLVSAIALAVAADGALAADISVQVSGIPNNDGQIGCALHRSAGTFPMGHDGIKVIWVRPKANRASCRFSDVTAGTYAIAVSHDLNNNKKTDTNLLGLPKEAWGVSGNVRPLMRAPRFSEASFMVGDNTVNLSVEVDK